MKWLTLLALATAVSAGTEGAFKYSCRAISQEVPTDWCEANCKPDYRGQLPPACQPNSVSPADQKCACTVPATDCEGTWEPWSECSATCGAGTQTRVYRQTATKRGYGQKCPWAHGAQEQRTCNQGSCEKEQETGPCKSVSQYVSDGWCEVVCKADSEGRFPSACVPNPASPLDQKCACDTVKNEIKDKEQEQPKREAQDCVGAWGPWSPCSRSCDGGTQTRVYFVAKPARMGGAPCPMAHGATQSQACGNVKCPIDPGQELPGSPQDQVPRQDPKPKARPCKAISPEVTDFWCLRNCIADGTGQMPPACRDSTMGENFQKCECDPVKEAKTGCVAAVQHVNDQWCESTCTARTRNGDVHPACRPGPFQECRCNFKPAPPGMKPTVPKDVRERDFAQATAMRAGRRDL